MLDPRLQTFLVLCDTMSYTRAAKQLCLTQPAVTQHIHYLEKHYGCKLVSYQGKVLRLTPAGERLREMVRSLSYNSHKMEEALASPRPAVLHIGATKTIGEYVLGPDLGRLLREYPECTVSLTVDNTKALLEALDRGTLDFALIEGFSTRRAMGTGCTAGRNFSACALRGHPAAGRELSLDGLLAENLIVREKGVGYPCHFRGVASFSQPYRRELCPRDRNQRFFPDQIPGAAGAGDLLPLRAGGGAGAEGGEPLPSLPGRFPRCS